MQSMVTVENQDSRMVCKLSPKHFLLIQFESSPRSPGHMSKGVIKLIIPILLYAGRSRLSSNKAIRRNSALLQPFVRDPSRVLLWKLSTLRSALSLHALVVYKTTPQPLNLWLCKYCYRACYFLSDA